MTATPLPQNANIETSEASLTATVPVTDELLYFPGHFPGQPILPGFAMIDWVIALAQSELRLTPAAFEPFRMEVIKFKSMVKPGMEVTFNIELKNDRLYYVVTSDEGEHCSGRICINLSE